MKSKITLVVLFILPFFMLSQSQIGGDIDGEAVGDEFGRTVAISSDGTIVAVGAPENDGINGTNSGQVRVYENTLGTWTQLGNDIDGEAGSDSFGFAISLSANGNILAVGAYRNDGNGLDSGHVRVYEYFSGNWNQIGSDIDGEAAFDRFGYSVSLSSSGDILAVGAPFNNGVAGSNTGHVRIFENISSTWTQIGSDIDGEDVNDQSGFSLDISSNGLIVAIGAPNNKGTTVNTNVGHVRVYENVSDVWTQIGNDIDGMASDNSFGTSLSLSSDGTIFASGMPFSDGIGVNSGLTRVYEYVPETWIQIGSDISGEAAQDESGHKNAISLSSNGNIIAIGARFNDGVNGTISGHSRVYQNISSTWTQIGTDIDGEAMDDQSGYSVDLSPNGATLVIGAPFNNNTTGGGHARVFDLSNSLSSNSFISDGFLIYPNPTITIFNIIAYETISEVLIYNFLGQELEKISGINNNKSQIDITNYQKGAYFVLVKTENSSETVKLIKN